MSTLGGRHLAALSELACLVADGRLPGAAGWPRPPGLSRAAVAQRVDLLISHGLLVETEPVATERGRPRWPPTRRGHADLRRRPRRDTTAGSL